MERPKKGEHARATTDEEWRRANQRVEHLHTPLNGLLPRATTESGALQELVTRIEELEAVVRHDKRARATLERDAARMRKALNAACAIIEMGDNRLLAGDGPAGGQPPALSLAEWRKLYVTLDKAR